MPWISRKEREGLQIVINDLKLRLSALEETNKISCEDENTRIAKENLNHYLDTRYSEWVIPEIRRHKSEQLVKAQLNQPTMSLHDAVIKIAAQAGLEFTTVYNRESKIVNERPALIHKDFNKKEKKDDIDSV